MTEQYAAARHSAAALAATAAILLVLEATKPGAVGTQLPLSAIAIALIIGVGAFAALPAASEPRLSAWSLLLLGWVSAVGGWVVYVALSNVTEYSLAIGCLAGAAAWAALVTLALQRPPR
jgi:hypothetical protein